MGKQNEWKAASHSRRLYFLLSDTKHEDTVMELYFWTELQSEADFEQRC